mmetsp:Transcript_43474/g.70544  ORF Transcript_43474/g.70544 Transcript_43474/m.70544 type:complete len:89 (+) Transcript_43474:129-395(+)
MDSLEFSAEEDYASEEIDFTFDGSFPTEHYVAAESFSLDPSTTFFNGYEDFSIPSFDEIRAKLVSLTDSALEKADSTLEKARSQLNQS